MSAVNTIISLLKQIKEAIGGEPPQADVLEIVKRALEKKLANKEQLFIPLLHNEFYEWLRNTIGPKATDSFWQRPINEARVQSDFWNWIAGEDIFDDLVSIFVEKGKPIQKLIKQKFIKS
jgi:hypothetical protein